MVYVKSLILLLSLNLVLGKSLLPELTAKQSIQNIKYLTKENDITFYVKSNKILSFSSNFKAYEILKNDTESEFGVIKHPTKNLYLITSKTSAYENLNSINDLDIYLYSTEDKKLTALGKGQLAMFNISGDFISFYSYQSSTFSFMKTTNIFDIYKIKLFSKNIFFTPQIAIFDMQNIFFTDCNDQNQVGLLKVNIEEKSRQTIMKSENVSTKFEITQSINQLYILETLYKKSGYANIYSLKKNENDISKRNFIYESADGSAFQMSFFNEGLLFIKNFGLGAKYSELYFLNLSTKKAQVISDLDFATSYFFFENNIYIPHRENIYVVNNPDKSFIISPKEETSGE